MSRFHNRQGSSHHSDGGKAKTVTGLMYNGSALKRGPLDDVKVVYFGPSERLMVEDADVASTATEMACLGEAYACKATSDRDKISKKIDDIGVRVEYVGSITSDYVKQGLSPWPDKEEKEEGYPRWPLHLKARRPSHVSSLLLRRRPCTRVSWRRGPAPRSSACWRRPPRSGTG